MQGLTHTRPNLPKGRDFPGRQIVTLAKAAVCVHGDSMMRNSISYGDIGGLFRRLCNCNLHASLREHVATEDFCCHTEA